MGKDFYIDRPVRKKSIDASEYYSRDASMPHAFFDNDEDNDFELTEVKDDPYKAPAAQDKDALKKEFEQTSAPYSSVSDDAKLKDMQEQKGFVSNITSTPEAKNNRPNIVVDRETMLSKLQQVKDIRSAQKKSHSEYMALKRQLYRTIRTSQGRREVNGTFRHIESEMKAEGFDWGTPGFVALVLSYYPDAIMTVTQPEKEENDSTDPSLSRKEDEKNQEEKSFMNDEMAVATDNHDLKIGKDAEGRNVLLPASEEKKQEESSLPESGSVSSDPSTTEDSKEGGEKSQDGPTLEVTTEEKKEDLVEAPIEVEAEEQTTTAGSDLVIQNDISSLENSQEQKTIEEARKDLLNTAEDKKRIISAEAQIKKQFLKDNASASIARITAQKAQKITLIHTYFDNSKKLVTAAHANEKQRLRQSLDKNVGSIKGNAAAKIQELTQLMSAKREDFAKFVSDQKKMPKSIAESEANRVDQELEAAAKEALGMGQLMASKYPGEEDKRPAQREAAIQLAKESAADIRSKKVPIRESLLEKAEEFEGEYDQYNELVNTKITETEQSIQTQIGEIEAKALLDIQQLYDTNDQKLDENLQLILQKIDATEGEVVEKVEAASVQAIKAIEETKQQGLLDVDKVRKFTLQSISSAYSDADATIQSQHQNNLEGILGYSYEVKDALEQVLQKGLSTMADAVSEKVVFVEETIGGFTNQTDTIAANANKVATAMTEKASEGFKQSTDAFDKAASSYNSQIADQNEKILAGSIAELDKVIGEKKDAIAAINEAFKKELIPITDESIEQAKLPLTDPLWDRLGFVTIKAGESWWSGLLAGIGEFLVNFIIIIAAIAAVAAIVALGIMAVVAIAGGAIAFGAAFAIAFAIVSIMALVVMVIHFVITDFIHRYGQGFSWWQASLLVITDFFGLTLMYEAVTGDEVGTDVELSTSERWKRGALGVLTLASFFIPWKKIGKIFSKEKVTVEKTPIETTPGENLPETKPLEEPVVKEEPTVKEKETADSNNQPEENTNSPSENKEKVKTKGEAEEQLTDKGANEPVPLTPAEMSRIQRWSNARNAFLKKWREMSIAEFKEELQRLFNGSADRSIRKNMTPDDLAAVIKEKKGIQILKSDGTPFKHLTEEWPNARRSILNNISEIKDVLAKMEKNGQTNTPEYKLLLERLSDLSKLLDLYESLI